MSVPLSAPVFFHLRPSEEVLPSPGAPVPESEAFIHNVINLKVSDSYFNVLLNVYLAGVCKPSRHVCSVCWAVPCWFL